MNELVQKKFNFFLSLIGIWFYVGTTVLIAQNDDINVEGNSKNYFIEVDFGIQMSGIKNEDFVKRNYSPLIRGSVGKWISRSINLKIGYQGRYFNTIDHERRRYYDFYFGEIGFDIKEVLNLKKNKKVFYKPIFHFGGGYFYNHDYSRASFHGILGLSNVFQFWDSLGIKLDQSSIIGWDIYQGDNDILPGLSLGLVYEFK